MKKVLGSLFTVAALLPLSASTAFAQGAEINPCPEDSQFQALCTLQAEQLGTIVGGAVTFLLIVAVLVALFFLIFGGIRWITSGGDKAKVESARGTIISAIIGLIIAFLAFFILSVALNFFGLNLQSLELPQIIT